MHVQCSAAGTPFTLHIIAVTARVLSCVGALRDFYFVTCSEPLYDTAERYFHHSARLKVTATAAPHTARKPCSPTCCCSANSSATQPHTLTITVTARVLSCVWEPS